MNLLDDLAFKYGADKTPRIKHHYTDVYFELFKDRRDTVKKVLEIGVAEGASLRMFRDFFPNATIYGAEVDQARVDKLQGLDRIEVFQCDQSIGNNLRLVIGTSGFDLDLVIDDGSHKPSDQLFSCLTIMQWLKKDCIYIIEDVAETEIIEDIKNAGYECELVKVGNRYDDCLIIVRHIK